MRDNDGITALFLAVVSAGVKARSAPPAGLEAEKSGAAKLRIAASRKEKAPPIHAEGEEVRLLAKFSNRRLRLLAIQGCWGLKDRQRLQIAHNLIQMFGSMMRPGTKAFR
jgi:hypothetical protein